MLRRNPGMVLMQIGGYALRSKRALILLLARLRQGFGLDVLPMLHLIGARLKANVVRFHLLYLKVVLALLRSLRDIGGSRLGLGLRVDHRGLRFQLRRLSRLLRGDGFRIRGRSLILRRLSEGVGIG